MGEEIRVGCIGVGQIGKRHLERYAKIEDARVVAIADISESELERVSETYGVPHTYTDFRELLDRDDIDAVDVCLHNNLHMPVTVAALEAGKHVYCEKPMAGAYCDAAVMLETAQKLGLKLSIQLNTLFKKETKAARILVDRGLLGRMYYARSVGHRRRGRPFVDGYGTAALVQKTHAAGGALYDMGVYHIAAMLYLLGNPNLLRVSGKTYQETAMDDARRQTSGYDVEELGLGFVRLEGDVLLEVFEAWAVHLDSTPSVIAGSEGGIRLKPLGLFYSVDDLDLEATANLESFDSRVHMAHEDADAYDSPEQHWIAALQGRVELLPTAELALNTMLISEGIYLSNELGREVSAEEIEQASRSTALEV